MDARALFSQLEYNSGEFPEDVLDDAIDQWESILPLLLEELRRAAADPVGLFDKGESYIRHIYATYLLAQFREAAAYPLLVDFVATPGEIVMELMGDVVTEDLGRLLASLCHGDPELIKRLIEEPEVNEWVRSAALDALLVLFGLGQLERDDIMGYLGELFRLKIERKPDYIWSSMVNMACDLYPGELMEEIRQAYDQGLVNPGDVNYREVEAILKLGKGETLEATLKHQRGLIGNVTDEIGWWACFGESNEEDNLDMDSFVLEDDDYSPAVETVVRSGPKIGRNDSCPCGSGKKYKHCCLTRRADPRQPGLAQSVLDEITEAAAQQPVATLDELNALATRAMNQRNRSALAEFCGLNPDQMTCMLYEPFTSPDTVCFSTGVQPVNKTGIMRVFIALVEAIGEDGLKATATGNLPLKFCKALAQQLREEDDNDDRLLLIGGIRSEKDLGVLHCTRLVAQLAGLIRKYRGKFVLTRKCRDMLASEDYGSLYFELFKAYSRKFNWGYRDGYPEAGIVQLSFLYTLFLLVTYGDVQRPQKFYEDKFLNAFPMALEMFSETSYSSAEDGARRCYFLRSLDQFAAFFGLAELKSESQELFQHSYVIGKSALLDRFVTFS